VAWSIRRTDMKNKIWSILSIIIAVICFVLSLVAFLVAAIGGKVNMANVAGTNYILTIIGLILGIIAVLCASQRTEWKVNMVQGFSTLAKIGIMVNIIVLAATLMNVR